MKDLIHICLENESQGHGMTLNMIYDRSKYPHFISYRGLVKPEVAFTVRCKNWVQSPLFLLDNIYVTAKLI